MTEIRMTGNLFQGSRMNGILLPRIGETVVLPDGDAAILVERGYAVVVEAETVDAAETRIVEAPEKRTTGRKPRG